MTNNEFVQTIMGTKLPQPKCCDPNLQFMTKTKHYKGSKSSKCFKTWLHYHKCGKCKRMNPKDSQSDNYFGN
jgi:hypothetical protein